MSDRTEARALALAGSFAKPMGWLIVLTTIPLIVAIVILAVVATHTANTPKAPPLFVLIAVPAIIVLAQFLIVRSLRNAGVSTEGGDLVIKTGMSTKRVPLANLRKHGLHIVNLNQQAQLKPWLRTMGMALPGFASGWFRLRNGEKAVCLLLDWDRVTHLRSDADNVTLLLSLAEPERLRSQLER
jgi:Bacterial PH domain